MYHNRRTIFKAEKVNSNNEMLSPYNENGKLNKGFRYSGNGEIKDSHGNVYLIADYK